MNIYVSVSSLLLFATCIIFGCGRGGTHELPLVKTMNCFRAISKHVHMIRKDNNNSPPKEMGRLVKWLENNTAKLDCVDYKKKSINDGWGRSVIILAKDDQLYGFGSSGADGIWQGGRGDDIICVINDISIHYKGDIYSDN